MDKKLAGLLGAAAALTTLTSAQAAPMTGSEIPQATSYRDLLDPIPNAVPLLKADDARLAQAPGVKTAEVVVGHHHHHHHGVTVRVGPRYHRHHHHHHHHYHYRDHHYRGY